MTLTLALAAAAVAVAQTLTPGVVHEQTLAPGETHVYQVQLAEGDLLDARVTPHGIDVALLLVSPGGGDPLKVDLSHDPETAESMLAVAPRAGRYDISVISTSDNVPAGGYEILLSDVHHATPADAARVEAMRKLEEAVRLKWQETTVSLTRAIELADAARAAFRDAGDGPDDARAQLEGAQASFYAFTPDARTRAVEIVARYRELDDRGRLADALNVLAGVYMRAGERAEAVERMSEALRLAQAIGNRTQEAQARNNLGLVYADTGNAERAVEHYRRGLVQARAMRMVRTEMALLNNLGIAEKNLGNYPEAIDATTRALALARSIDNAAGQARALNGFSNIYHHLGEHQHVVEVATEALAIARRVGNPDQEGIALNALGVELRDLGELDKAMDYEEQALAIRRRLNYREGEATCLDAMASILNLRGDRDGAVALLNDALRIERSLSMPYRESDTLLKLAEVERDRGNLDAALDHIEASVRLTDTLRGRVVSPDLRAAYVASARERYETYVDVLMRLDAAHPHADANADSDTDAGYAARALEASEAGRARVLLESLLEARTDIRQGIDPALLARERDQRQQLDEASTRLSKVMGRQSDAKTVDAARAALEAASAGLQQIEARVRLESPAYASLTQAQPVDVATIQRELVDADTLLLEFSLGDARSWLWVVGPSAITSVPLPPRARIETAAREIYGLLTARLPRTGETAAARTRRIQASDAQWRRASRAFSEMLLGPAAARLGAGWRNKRLLIAADGALEYISFATLPEPARAPVAPLVRTHEIVNVPSASVLSAIRQQTAGRPAAPRSVAVLADPVFDADDPRVRRAASHVAAAHILPAQAASGTTRDAESIEEPVLAGETSFVSRAIRASDESTTRGEARAPRLPRLPFSRQEGDAIAAFAPVRERLEAMDFRASRALVTSGELGAYRYVHFATHGFLNSERPELSGLVLSLVRPDGAPQDGFLRLNDVYNLRLSADVVVLSACQTALGKNIRGEGLVGLTRGFMYAGAPRIVASLWAVDDAATAELMRLFYQGLLKEHLRPAAALRSAQRALAAQPRWASPYYWAAFVLQGEWK